MKVLLVCAGGISTSILMKKLERYAEDQGIEFSITAVGLSAYKDAWQQGYDCILMGPQVGYRIDELKKECTIPVDIITPADYGIGNCKNIFDQLDAMLGK